MAYKRGALPQLEKEFTSNGYKIRYERGHFKAGYCLVQSSKVIIVNKFYNNEARYNCLMDIIEQNGLSELLDSENAKDEALEEKPTDSPNLITT